MEVTNGLGPRAQAVRGTAYTGLAQVYRVGLNFVTNILLARLLTPADFGLIAMVASFATLVTLIQDLGLSQATIQREQISRSQMSALFWLSVGSSLALSVLLALSAPAIAWFFGDSRLIALTVASSGLLVLGGAQSQQLALMNRELRFKALAAIDVLTTTASAIAGVSVAWLTASYWALFAAGSVATVVSFTCAWLLSGFRLGSPSFEGDFRAIAGFGSAVSGFNIVNYFSRNADNVLIGRIYGSEQLGLYDRAYRSLLFPLSQIQAPLGRIMMPTLARLQKEPERYRQAYIESISLLMAATQPGLVFAIIFAEDVFFILFGPRWMPAGPIFRWLGIAGLSQVMTTTSGWLFLSQGRGSDYFRIGLFGALSTVASFVVGIFWGPLGVAIAYTVDNYVMLLPATWWSAGRRGPVTTGHLICAAIPHATACSGSALAMLVVANTANRPGILGCTALIILSYSVYILILLVFPQKRGMFGNNLVTLRRLLRFTSLLS